MRIIRQFDNRMEKYMFHNVRLETRKQKYYIKWNTAIYLRTDQKTWG